MADTLSVAGLRAVQVTLHAPFHGVWTAEADVDLGESGVVPSGRVVLKIGQQVLSCTVDSTGSGKFGSKALLRLIGGAGGWVKPVQSRDFSNPAGVLTTNVFSATAAEVGETVVVANPETLNQHYVRTLGPASRVLLGRDWYVDLAGVTHVGPRPQSAAPADLVISSYDATARTVQVATDAVIVPGTVLKDAKFGQLFVRDVEQTWSDSGARATLSCSADATASPGALGRVAGALQSMARETMRPEYLQLHRYRVASQNGDGTFRLQALKVRGPVPDTLPVTPWYGVGGMSSKVTPGCIVLVQFISGDPSLPIVVGFDDKAAIEVHVDAVKLVVGEGTQPVALATSTKAALDALATAVKAALALVPGGGTASTALDAALEAPLASMTSLKTFSE